MKKYISLILICVILFSLGSCNKDNTDTPHLHFGIQLIFDESQKDGVNQIWIDCYQIINFLEKYRAKV